MRTIIATTALMLCSVMARAQEPPPPQYPPQQQYPQQYPQQQYPQQQYPQQPPPPQYGQPPYGQPAYGQPAYGQPQMDPERLRQWEFYRNRAHRFRVGGRAALGVGIAFFAIGVTVAVLATYNNGVYLCSGITCDDGAAEAAGITLAIIGAGGIGAGIALLVLANSNYEKSERVRMGMQVLNYIPRVSPLARLDGHGVDGATAMWSFRF